MLDQDKITDKHLRWEFLKYEIRKFTINFSKKRGKDENKDRNFLEKELKKLEKNLNNLQINEYYLGCKQKLQNICTKKVNGIRIRSKSNWYENEEKSTKFFLNLEKHRATQGCLRTIIQNKKEINDSQQKNDALCNFYQTFFKEKLSISEECIQSFLDKVSLPKLNENQTFKCEGAITECEHLKALTSMDNDKSLGNDGITKEFYMKFWDAVKEPLCASIQQSSIAGELNTSQKQAIKKLIKKKDRDKRFIKNWRPISLLNVDMKQISKVLASRSKSVISFIVNENLLTKIQMEFIWKGKNPKIKNSTLGNDYEYGGLKNVDIFSKVVSLQCSWTKRLFDNDFCQWKLIPLYLIRQYLGKKIKFHSNLEVSLNSSFLNSIKRYSLDGANIFFHWLLCHQQLNVSLFGLTSIFKLIIKAFIFIISRIGI